MIASGTIGVGVMCMLVQDDPRPHAEQAGSAFQQLKGHLPHLFLECNDLSASLPRAAAYICVTTNAFTHFSTDSDQAHLYASDSHVYNIVNSVDSQDLAGLVDAAIKAQPRAQRSSEGTRVDDAPETRDPKHFADWSRSFLDRKSSFRASCQVGVQAARNLMSCT